MRDTSVVTKSHVTLDAQVTEEVQELMDYRDGAEGTKGLVETEVQQMELGTSEAMRQVESIQGIEFILTMVPFDQIVIEGNVRDTETLVTADIEASMIAEGYDRTRPLMGHVRPDGRFGLIRGHRRHAALTVLEASNPVAFRRCLDDAGRAPMLLPKVKRGAEPRRLTLDEITLLKLDHNKTERPLTDWEKFISLRQLRRIGWTKPVEIMQRLGMVAVNPRTGVLELQRSQFKKLLTWLKFNETVLAEVRIYKLFGRDTLVNATNGLRICPENPKSVIGTDCEIRKVVAASGGEIFAVCQKGGDALTVANYKRFQNVRMVANCRTQNLDRLSKIVNKYGDSSDRFSQVWEVMLDGQEVKLDDQDYPIKPEDQGQPGQLTVASRPVDRAKTEAELLDIAANFSDVPIIRDVLNVAAGAMEPEKLAELASQVVTEVTRSQAVAVLAEELAVTAESDRADWFDRLKSDILEAMSE